MRKVIYSDDALSDLKNIFLFIAGENIDAAERVVETIEARIDQLPYVTDRPCSEGGYYFNIPPKPANKYVIFFRPVPEKGDDGYIYVARIFHGARITSIDDMPS